LCRINIELRKETEKKLKLLIIMKPRNKEAGQLTIGLQERAESASKTFASTSVEEKREGGDLERNSGRFK